MVTELSNLATVAEPRSAAAEAYRTLRANLQFAFLERPLRSLLVTSAGAEEDRSAVSANLAATIAQGGQRVVLVDCDLRQPRLHTLLGLSNERGLSSLALGDAEPYLQSTGLANLQLLAAGPLPANPLDVLLSGPVQAALAELREKFDVLVCDAPPVLAVADAAMLARGMDGVVLVFRAGRSKRDQAGKARALLAKAGANVLGAVLTNAKVDASFKGYYG